MAAVASKRSSSLVNDTPPAKASKVRISSDPQAESSGTSSRSASKPSSAVSDLEDISSASVGAGDDGGNSEKPEQSERKTSSADASIGKTLAVCDSKVCCFHFIVS